jgi:hypothetical protein
MQKPQLLAAALLAISLAATGCVVHEREVVTRPAEPCPGAVWVERGEHSHWECPAREKVEVIQVRP